MRSTPDVSPAPSATGRPRLGTLLAVGLLSLGTLVGCGSSSDDATTTTTVALDATGTTVASTPDPTEAPSTVAPTTPDTTAPDGNPVTGDAVDAPESSWTAAPTAYRQKVRTRIRYTCPPAGTTSTIWGTGTYRDDSPVCVAAVHAGLISLDVGGTVIVQVTGPADGFTGSTANGVTSQDASAASGSYTFPTS